MSDVSILVLVGSLRSGSKNRELAEAAVDLAPAGTSLTIFEGLADLPFYNEDIDLPDSAPAGATAFREALASVFGGAAAAGCRPATSGSTSERARANALAMSRRTAPAFMIASWEGWKTGRGRAASISFHCIPSASQDVDARQIRWRQALRERGGAGSRRARRGAGGCRRPPSGRAGGRR